MCSPMSSKQRQLSSLRFNTKINLGGSFLVEEVVCGNGSQGIHGNIQDASVSRMNQLGNVLQFVVDGLHDRPLTQKDPVNRVSIVINAPISIIQYYDSGIPLMNKMSIINAIQVISSIACSFS